MQQRKGSPFMNPAITYIATRHPGLPEDPEQWPFVAKLIARRITRRGGYPLLNPAEYFALSPYRKEQ